MRLLVEGESVRPGSRPVWLAAASRLEITGLQAGSAVVVIEAPTLREAAPERFGRDSQALLFGEPTRMLDVDQTGVDFFGRVLASASSEDREGLLADRALLDTCVRFACAVKEPFESLRLDGAESRQAVVVSPSDVARFRQLRDETPGPRAVRVTGTLDTISVSRSDVVLRLPGGVTVAARMEQHDPELLKGYFGSRVVVSGLAHYRPSGGLLVVDVEDLAPAQEADELWAAVPVASPARRDEVAISSVQDEASGVAAFFGTWPGEESEQELLAALKNLE